ncbi:MAG: ABC-F family ATP-binding cassette domain-containing protein [Chloroflexi bacterium]|nr:ABC-F family ATP-binding cassette domain-containing protein [Chloroflexota bacterium]
MPILSANNLSLSFGATTIFSGIEVSIQPNAKIGLVGPNGVGKTSLLFVLNGLTPASTGHIHKISGLRIGYLHQEAMQAFADHENTVYSEMLTVFAGLRSLELRLRDLEERMADNYSEELLDKYGRLQAEFEHAGGYDYELRIEQTLHGLGFDDSLYDTSLAHLSGGQKTRALLARLLLEQPELLILDEPTNHLDVEAVEWLEGRLRAWEGALLIVSHDRYFLDRVVSTIWDMSRVGIEAYRGNYSAYAQQRQERIEYAEKMYDHEMERLAKELDYIKRNIVRASTNGMAVGRLRRLSRDLVAIQEVGLVNFLASSKWSELGIGGVHPFTVMEAEQAVKAIHRPTPRLPKFNMRLTPTNRSGEIVLRTNDLLVGYPERPLFTSNDIVLLRRECAAIIGGNGTGKTTLLRTLMGQLAPLDGHIEFGASLKIGYFAQAHNSLNPENTVLDELISHKFMRISEARSHLAKFLFRNEDVFKKVEMLSGGERAKLAMAILALDGANLLLLDEPTNHLDIAAQESLQEVLESFDGTVLLVTHDRYLVDRLATQIWSLEDGHMGVFKGNYRAYVEERAIAATL